MLELVQWVSWFGALVSAMGALAGCKSRPKAELVSDPAGDMILLPKATLELGKGTAEYDTNPLRTVTVGPVAIDLTEVTVAAYRRCVEMGPCSVPGGPHSFAPGTRESCNWGVPGKDNHPINCVDFNQAVTYCSWARKRLPNDDEWEYAARGTDGRPYPWGDSPPSDQLCWKRKASKGGTCAVGSHSAGARRYGELVLYDMTGNVAEWVKFAESEPFMMPHKGAQRLVRGGSWQSEQEFSVQATWRAGVIRTLLDDHVGFRCAK